MLNGLVLNKLKVLDKNHQNKNPKRKFNTYQKNLKIVLDFIKIQITNQI